MQSFAAEVNRNNDFDPDESVFDSIWDKYESIVLQSLVTSFGLDFLINDQYGGDVDTIHNVRKIDSDKKMKYKNRNNEIAYDNEEKYSKKLSAEYHQDEEYKKISKDIYDRKKQGDLTDAYTGKKIKINDKIDVDHVISVKEIADDRGRILADVDGKELANNKYNLKATKRSINRSKLANSAEEYLNKLETKSQERRVRIAELKARPSLTDRERKELNKLNDQENVDHDRMRAVYKKAYTVYESRLNKYYTSSRFAKDTAVAAGKVGVKMGIRQALGFVFIEVYYGAKKELQSLPAGSGLKEMLAAVGRGIKNGLENAREKYKQIFEMFKQGLAAGAISSLTTTICNIFFTTSENLVRCTRQIYAAVIQAGKVILFNPDNLYLGERLKTGAVILASGASVLIGSAVGDLIAATPVGMMPVIGSIVTTFVSTLVSGLLSCTFLVFLDRSHFINMVVDLLNELPSEISNYRQIADKMDEIAAKLGKLDIEKFRKDTQIYDQLAAQLDKCDTEEEINHILLGAYRTFGIKIPWKGDFDEFMADGSNHLVFE